MSLFRKYLKKLRKDESGSILTELAVSSPIFIGILSGVTEASNYMLLHMKMQHTVISIADLTTRDEDIDEDTMSDIFQAIQHIMAPYDPAVDSRMYVTAISQNSSTPPSIFWQRSGGGSLAVGSLIGSEGDSITLPAGLSLRDDETILVTEYFYSYKPLIFDFYEGKTIRKVAFFRPRIGALQEISS